MLVFHHSCCHHCEYSLGLSLYNLDSILPGSLFNGPDFSNPFVSLTDAGTLSNSRLCVYVVVVVDV